MNWTPKTDNTSTISSECYLLQLYLLVVFEGNITYIWKKLRQNFWNVTQCLEGCSSHSQCLPHWAYTSPTLLWRPWICSLTSPWLFYTIISTTFGSLLFTMAPVHPSADVPDMKVDGTLLLRPRHPVRPTSHTLAWVRFIQLLYNNPATWFLCISYLVPEQHG